jgi:hypothetical protein
MAKVFISYSHDSAEHDERVLRFADALRGHGIDAELDRYHQRPTQGWPAWCEEQLRPEVSGHVLMICTRTYHDRVQNQVPVDEGNGVFWEGRIIHNYVYGAKRNERFIPVLFDGATADDIPIPIRNDGHYTISRFDLTDPGYEALCRDLTGQPYVTKPDLGNIVPLAERQPLTSFQAVISSSRLTSAPLLIGRESELAMLDAAWSGDAKKNVVTIVAFGGVGKSTLAAQWAATKYDDVERYFDWSFYRQGSSDVFLKTALEFFGDAELAASAADGWTKGDRLAQLAGQHRTLLILDGLEPLQDAKTGELRDPALTALLRGLAARNRGLCVVTTRQEIPDLDTFRSTTAPQWKLERLSKEAGASLLEKLGVRGTGNERETLAGDVKGHALTLTLLGKYLAEAHGGDIRKRDLVSLHEADSEETSGHAFRVMEVYEQWLTRDGRHVELAILRLLGLFDRPATPDCFGALREAPAIDGLTDSVVRLTDAQWNLAVKRLVRLGFVEEQPWEPPSIAGYSEEEARRVKAEKIPLGEAQPQENADERRRAGNALDAHPLIREYFAQRLRESAPEALQAAHGRLYEHLRDSVPYWPEGVDGLQPLYQAVVHGCQAGRAAETREQIYRDRILRGTSGPYASYSTKILGLTGADLAAVQCFFTVPWKQLTAELTAADQSWLLNEAAYSLRALGRLDEAREPMRACLEASVALADWNNAAIDASNLSELDLTLGDVASAVRHAEQSVQHADRSQYASEIMVNRAIHADALHQAGREAEAGERFREAKALQSQQDPTTPFLYSSPGFRFCDLLLARTERAAWRRCMGSEEQPLDEQILSDVEHRATTALAIAMRHHWVLSAALDNLTLGRAALFRAVLGNETLDSAHPHVEAAARGLRQAGAMHHLPRTLLTRAWLRALHNDPAAARADLDEAQQLAERGPMRLFLADVHLHRRAPLLPREPRRGARGAAEGARPHRALRIPPPRRGAPRRGDGHLIPVGVRGGTDPSVR